MKIVSAHQPAFLPWLGLVHKLMVSDVFIFMDIAKFRKRAFMHRNYIEINDTKKFIGLKVNKDSDYKTCDEVKISEFHSNNIMRLTPTQQTPSILTCSQQILWKVLLMLNILWKLGFLLVQSLD